MRFNSMVLNNTKFFSITFLFKKETVMLASGWALTKGDWWYKDKPENRNFFSVEKEVNNAKSSFGIYIGRLALRLMKNQI